MQWLHESTSKLYSIFLACSWKFDARADTMTLLFTAIEAYIKCRILTVRRTSAFMDSSVVLMCTKPFATSSSVAARATSTSELVTVLLNLAYSIANAFTLESTFEKSTAYRLNFHTQSIRSHVVKSRNDIKMAA